MNNYEINDITITLVYVQVNGNPLFIAYADGNNPDVETARNGGMVDLVVDDVVKVEILFGKLDGGWQKSTFSGYLVYEDY